MNDQQLKQAIEASEVYKNFEKFKQNITSKLSNIQRLRPYYEQAKKYGIDYLKQNPNITQGDVKLIESIL